MHPSKGVHFYVPPGCSKIFLAKAIANEYKANVENLSSGYIWVSPLPKILNRESPTRTRTDKMMFPSIRAHAASAWTSHHSLIM